MIDSLNEVLEDENLLKNIRKRQTLLASLVLTIDDPNLDHTQLGHGEINNAIHFANGTVGIDLLFLSTSFGGYEAIGSFSFLFVRTVVSGNSILTDDCVLIRFVGLETMNKSEAGNTWIRLVSLWRLQTMNDWTEEAIEWVSPSSSCSLFVEQVLAS